MTAFWESALIPLSFKALQQKKEAPLSKNLLGYRGKTGIRTLGTVARSPHFECGPIDHSGNFPCKGWAYINKSTLYKKPGGDVMKLRRDKI